MVEEVICKKKTQKEERAREKLILIYTKSYFQKYVLYCTVLESFFFVLILIKNYFLYFFFV